jgi:hypothetical protein
VYPAWSRDGKELLYRAGDLRVMSVPYNAKGDTFTPGKPHVWTDAAMMALGTYTSWDLAPDGKRIVAFFRGQNDNQPPVTHLTFLLNFTDDLQRR